MSALPRKSDTTTETQRGVAATKPTAYHRDTEDTEKGVFSKTGSLRDLGVFVVTVSHLAVTRIFATAKNLDVSSAEVTEITDT